MQGKTHFLDHLDVVIGAVWVAGGHRGGAEPSSICAGWRPGGVSAQILLTMCLPKLAKATEGKINHREGCLELCWKTGRSDSLRWFHCYDDLN